MAQQRPVARYWCEWAWTGESASAVPGVALGVSGDGTFTEVTPNVAAPADAERLPGLTLPGLANTHSHAFHRTLRARAHTGGSFWAWRDQMYGVLGRLTPDSYHRLARAVYAEMACAGVTCVGEFHYLHHTAEGRSYDNPNAMGEALVAAADEAGIRITLLDTCYLAGGLSPAGRHLPLEGPQLRFGDADAETWAARVDAFRPDSGHARVGAAAHSVRAVPAPELARVASWASRHRMPLHVHVSEQPAENDAAVSAYGRTPAGVLADAGALTPRTELVHSTHLSDGDVRALREAQAGVCLCPTTERDLADGLPRTGDLAAAPTETGGPVRLSVGTDQHVHSDMFGEMRGVELHERLRTGTRGTLEPAQLLTAGTRNGHTSLGWNPAGTEAGVLRAGARADLVTVGLDSVRLAGTDTEDVVAAVVYAATAADVRNVMVDGRWTVREGTHATLPDTAVELDTAIRELYP
ncbi:formiminoglutamate deiminase [Haloactinospora alba]|uniref:Formiminoglutamate deiminase n=1 Tax=Haloactinospora alba TaxID=405555 RepID=A0A543NHR6_9ACTN|nr:formimidoylglutamate deiminase [Haloactinospora alba]TQN31373.1 formiminoglutamate deiminase [Haloactinospora alba]